MGPTNASTHATRLDQDIRELRADMRRVIETLANDVRPSLASVLATVEAERDRRGAENAALFDSKAEHERRIAAIELAYVRQTEFRRELDEIKRANGDVANKLDGVRQTVTRWGGALALVSAIASFAVNWLMKGM